MVGAGTEALVVVGPAGGRVWVLPGALEPGGMDGVDGVTWPDRDADDGGALLAAVAGTLPLGDVACAPAWHAPHSSAAIAAVATVPVRRTSRA
ncbi:MAG: hypothetical protein DLM56_05615 [Pseudonocardiales bacterium]|nr:MAG: hypothetical protein DLM56_05615 [Pseudonocardiales bacterium]